MPVSSELPIDATVVFFYENDQKQTEGAILQFQLKELSVAFSYELTPNITGLVKAKRKQKSY